MSKISCVRNLASREGALCIKDLPLVDERRGYREAIARGGFDQILIRLGANLQVQL